MYQTTLGIMSIRQMLPREADRNVIMYKLNFIY